MVRTHAPHAIASSTGRPNPSRALGTPRRSPREESGAGPRAAGSPARRRAARPAPRAIAGSISTSQPGAPASTSAGGSGRSLHRLDQARTRAGTFLRGSRVPRNATYGRAQAELARTRSVSACVTGWKSVGSTPWYATWNRRRSCAGVPHHLVAGRHRRHDERSGPTYRGTGGRAEERPLTCECSSGWLKNVASCSVTTTGTGRAPRRRVVRAVQDVGTASRTSAAGPSAPTAGARRRPTRPGAATTSGTRDEPGQALDVRGAGRRPPASTPSAARAQGAVRRRTGRRRPGRRGSRSRRSGPSRAPLRIAPPSVTAAPARVPESSPTRDA